MWLAMPSQLVTRRNPAYFARLKTMYFKHAGSYNTMPRCHRSCACFEKALLIPK